MLNQVINTLSKTPTEPLGKRRASQEHAAPEAGSPSSPFEQRKQEMAFTGAMEIWDMIVTQ
jgi:hypothetical protein